MYILKFIGECFVRCCDWVWSFSIPNFFFILFCVKIRIIGNDFVSLTYTN